MFLSHIDVSLSPFLSLSLKAMKERKEKKKKERKKLTLVGTIFPNDISDNVLHLNCGFEYFKEEKTYLLEGSCYGLNFIYPQKIHPQ